MLKAIQPGGVCWLNGYMDCLGVGSLWFPFFCLRVLLLVRGFGGLLAYLFVVFVWLVFLVKIACHI